MTATITKRRTKSGHPYAVARDNDHRPTARDLPLRQVEKVAARAAEFIAKWNGSLSTEHPPTVYPPGYHSSGWTVAYEGAYEWTLHILDDEGARAITAEHDLFLEPVNGWCLGVYPG